MTESDSTTNVVEAAVYADKIIIETIGGAAEDMAAAAEAITEEAMVGVAMNIMEK